MPSAAEAQQEGASSAITITNNITEAMIDQLVRTFYTRVRADALLGPIFAAHVDDWEPHLGRMTAFWSSVMLMSGRYHGSPMAKHLPLPIEPHHFRHWLELFEQSVREVCPPQTQSDFLKRAQKIAQSLSYGVTARANRSAPILSLSIIADAEHFSGITKDPDGLQ